MSGQQFLETLHQIGYPQAQTLSPVSFDWMFDDDQVLPFLSWFCSAVGRRNVLTQDEKTEFSELQQSGQPVLEGAVLEEVLSCVSSGNDDEESLETLQADIDRMKDDLERQRQRKDKLVKTRNTLSLHHTGLTHRLSKMSEVEAVKKQQYRQCLDKCHHANDQTNASLERLADSVHTLCGLYQSREQPQRGKTDKGGGGGNTDKGGGGGDAVFLSHLPLHPFYTAEDLYTKQLTAFTKKVFFDGIADIAGGELSRYQLVEASDVTSLLAKGQSHDAFLQDCQELTRLQTVFGRSEGERINALVEAKCVTSMCSAANDILRDIQHGRFPSDIQAINAQVQDVKSTLSAVREELVRVVEGEVGVLVRELGKLQGTRVMTGDYTLKLARQDYFTANQDQVIQYLVKQRARNEFVTMAYEIEARTHRHIHRLLTVVHNTLQQRLDQYHARMRAMDDPSLTKARYDRGTIDTRDVATTCLHRMLVSTEESTEQHQLFLSYSSIVRAAEALHSAHTTARTTATSTADKYQDKVHNLERDVYRCEEVLYGESSTAKGRPSLMPGPLQEASTQLSETLSTLEAAIRDILNDIASKKQSLKKDVLVNKERKLFTYFHQHPNWLKQILDSLQQRLQAHSVK